MPSAASERLCYEKAFDTRDQNDKQEASWGGAGHPGWGGVTQRSLWLKKPDSDPCSSHSCLMNTETQVRAEGARGGASRAAVSGRKMTPLEHLSPLQASQQPCRDGSAGKRPHFTVGETEFRAGSPGLPKATQGSWCVLPYCRGHAVT